MTISRLKLQVARKVLCALKSSCVCADTWEMAGAIGRTRMPKIYLQVSTDNLEIDKETTFGCPRDANGV